MNFMLLFFNLKQRVYELGEVKYVASRLSIINNLHVHKTEAVIFPNASYASWGLSFYKMWRLDNVWRLKTVCLYSIASLCS